MCLTVFTNALSLSFVFSLDFSVGSCVANQHECGSLHGHELTSQSVCFSGDMMWPGKPPGCLPQEWPSCEVYFDPLRILVVAQQRLQMLPAIKSADFAKGWVHDTLQRLGLAIPPNGALNVRSLDLARVQDDVAGLGDKGLCDIILLPARYLL